MIPLRMNKALPEFDVYVKRPDANNRFGVLNVDDDDDEKKVGERIVYHKSVIEDQPKSVFQRLARAW